jgi:hypothetical protein
MQYVEYGTGELKDLLRDGWEPFSAFKVRNTATVMLRRNVEKEGRPPPGKALFEFLDTIGNYTSSVSKFDALADLGDLLRKAEARG